MIRRIMVVDDEESIRLSLKGALEDEGFEVISVSDGERALKALEEDPPGLTLLDIWMPGMDGMELLRTIKEREPTAKVIMISGHGTIETAVKATKLGAFDFIEKPLSLDKLLLTINNALAFKELEEENIALKEEVQADEELIGYSSAMRELKEQIARAAPTDGWVLITGENGTGKELVARAIHRNSLRRAKSFVAVNCAAIPEELIESELFGHEKGAFTGAFARKKGKFEQAHLGTIFLDEIGDMSLKTQAKILRTLQEQRFERVGGSQNIRVDVRVIAASNKDLGEEIKKGVFREDLFYRINVIPFWVPPLRERSEDIPLFVQHFVRQFCSRRGRELKEIEPAAMGCLTAYPWPGNVRELKNIIERLVIMCPGRSITLEDIPPPIGPGKGPEGVGQAPSDLKDARRWFERGFIIQKLSQHGWSIPRTAQAINMSRSHLHQKIKALNIPLKNQGPTQ